MQQIIKFSNEHCNNQHNAYLFLNCLLYANAWRCKRYAPTSVPCWYVLGFGIICKCFLTQSCNMLFWLKFQCIEWALLSCLEIVHCMKMHNNASDMRVSAWSFKYLTLIFVRIVNDLQMLVASIMYGIDLLSL